MGSRRTQRAKKTPAGEWGTGRERKTANAGALSGRLPLWYLEINPLRTHRGGVLTQSRGNKGVSPPAALPHWSRSTASAMNPELWLALSPGLASSRKQEKASGRGLQVFADGGEALRGEERDANSI